MHLQSLGMDWVDFILLQEACINLEHTMWRLESLLNLLLSNHGKSIISDYSVLEAVSKVIEYNFGMVTTIARSSRSYSIGLRNGDLEVRYQVSSQLFQFSSPILICEGICIPRINSFVYWEILKHSRQLLRRCKQPKKLAATSQ